MVKRIISERQRSINGPIPRGEWLDLENLADIELTSEDSAHPIEAALSGDEPGGWRASTPGSQMIRFIFHKPQRIGRIRLRFVEPTRERTQQFTLRWADTADASPREIVRQQWNFNPHDATDETEDYQVELRDVAMLELEIVPDTSGGEAHASLETLRLA